MTSDTAAGIHREIVKGLYRLIFARDPDPEGLVAHSAAVDHALREGRFDSILSTFLQSPEGRARQVRLFFQEEAKRVLAPLDGALPVFISLGTHCYTAGLLKEAGLKTGSYPFDWLFSNPAMVLHCLQDDFATFLSRDHYLEIPVEKRANPTVNLCDHVYYRDQFGVGAVFNHRDPRRDDDYQYLERCVGRLRSALNSGRPLVFVSTFRASETGLSSFLQVADYLIRINGNCKIAGVIIDERGSRVTRCEKLVSMRDRTHLFKLTSSSAWLDVRFESPIDDLALLSALVDVASVGTTGPAVS